MLFSSLSGVPRGMSTAQEICSFAYIGETSIASADVYIGNGARSRVFIFTCPENDSPSVVFPVSP